MNNHDARKAAAIRNIDDAIAIVVGQYAAAQREGADLARLDSALGDLDNARMSVNGRTDVTGPITAAVMMESALRNGGLTEREEKAFTYALPHVRAAENLTPNR